MDEEHKRWPRTGVARYQRRSVLRGVALAGVSLAGSSLLACAGGGNRSSRTAAGPSGTQASEGPPQSGGTLNLAVPENVPTWDPHRTTSSYAKTQLGMLTSRLLQFKTAVDPAVAGSFTVQSDLA